MAEWRQSWSGDGSWRVVENRSNFNQNRWQSSASRPPIHPGVEDGIPLWEKKYCTTMLRMPWKMLCLNQNYLGLWKNVLEWDDSGALEAFQNAKARFCAEYHGAPCSIPLPDPDLYIDKVDHDCFVDPELVEDLDKEPPPPVDVVEFGGVNSVIVRDSCDVTPTGWDDVVDNGAGDRRDGNWDTNVERSMQADGWGDAQVPDNSGWNAKERNNEWGSRKADRKVAKDDPWNSATTGWGDAAGPANSGWNVKERNNEWGSHETNRKTSEVDPWHSATTGWGNAAGPANSGWNAKERNNAWSSHETNRQTSEVDPWHSATTGWGNAAGPAKSGWNAKERNNEWGFHAPDRKTAEVDSWNSAAATGWGDAPLPSDSWSSGRDNQNQFGRNSQPWKNKNWESNRRYGRKRDAVGRTNGRYTKPKFNLGVYQPNNDWRNHAEGNSSDSRYEKKAYPKQPLAW